MEVVVDSLVPELARCGHEITVYGYATYTKPTDDYHGVRIKTISGLSTKNLEMISHMWSASVDVRRERYDLVHIHSTDPCLLAWLPASRHAVVATSHGQAYQRKKWGFLPRMMSKVAEYFYMFIPEVVTSVSKPLADYYKSKYSKDVRYIPNGIKVREKPPQIFLKKWELQPYRYLFCSAGRIERTKGLDTLFEAYSKTKTLLPLIIAGGGSGSDLPYFDQLKRNKPGGVHFAGFLSGDELFSLYAYARVFVFPSEYEAMSMALLEGLSFGVPTVYSDIPENRAVAGEFAYPFDVSDAFSLRETIQHVLANESEAFGKAEKARDYILDKHNWKSIAGQYNQIYLECLEARKASRKGYR